MLANPIISEVGRPNAKRVRKTPLQYRPGSFPEGGNDYTALCALNRAGHYCSTGAGLPPKKNKKNMAAMLRTRGRGSCFPGQRKQMCVCVRGNDGCIAVAPVHNSPPPLLGQHSARCHSTVPRLPPTLDRQTEREAQTFLIIHQVRMTHGG